MRHLFYALFGLLVCWQSVFSQNAAVELTFSDLSDFIDTHSPIAAQLNQQLNLSQAERSIALSWSNPSIDYAEETLDGGGNIEREQFLTFSKQIEMPWTYRLRRQAWNALGKSTDFSIRQQRKMFLSEMKAGYVALQSMNNSIQRLDRFRGIIHEISGIAQNQTAERTISAFDHQLFQMALLSLQARRISIEKERQQLEGELKMKLGINQSQQLTLVSVIAFKAIELKSADAYFASILNTPGIQSEHSKLAYLNKMIQVESSAFIPSLDVSAGLKRFADAADGYTFGISLPLPIFNQNMKQARIFKIQRNIQETNFALHLNLSKNRTQLLIDEINRSAEFLKGNQSLFESKNNVTENVLLNYQQGSISITDVLNTILVYTESVENYYDQLNAYYQAVFNLEAEFDVTLITF
jgi:outer membrane protein TolC